MRAGRGSQTQRTASFSSSSSTAHADLSNAPGSSSPLNNPSATAGPSNWASSADAKKASQPACLECRRLKRKCDRPFPCTMCKKRGVADLCPDGVLTAGPGSRYILANTEELIAKVQEMSERIRSLENALEALHSERSHGMAHPLMQKELASIKDTSWLHHRFTNSTDEASTPSQSSVSHSPRPRTSSSSDGSFSWENNSDLHLSEPLDHEAKLDADLQRLSPILLNLPQSLTPYGNNDHQAAFRRFLRSKLPNEKEAYRLWEILRRNALWQRRPHSIQTSFFTRLYMHCLNAPISILDQACLSLVFMMFSVACAVDLDLPLDTATSNGANYHRIARAAMFLSNTLGEPNVECVMALFYDVWYVCGFSETKDTSAARGVMGLAVTLAQKLSLHREDPTTIKSVLNISEEDRRWLFWELTQLDVGFSLYFNGPPMLPPIYFACPRPSYETIGGDDPDNTSVLKWRHDVFLECLAPAAELNARNDMEYSDLLAVDARIRTFLARSRDNAIQNYDIDTDTVLRQMAWTDVCMDGALLKLHQSFFSKALNAPSDGGKSGSPYAASVVAVFLSSCRLIDTVMNARDRDPKLIPRFSPYGHNLWNSMAPLCVLVYKAPWSCLAPVALQVLERCRTFFFSGETLGIPQTVTMVAGQRGLVRKINDIYAQWVRKENESKDKSPTPSLSFDLFSSPSPEGGSSCPSPGDFLLLAANGERGSLSPNVHDELIKCFLEAQSYGSYLRRLARNRKTASSSFDWDGPAHEVLPSLYTASIAPGLASTSHLDLPWWPSPLDEEDDARSVGSHRTDDVHMEGPAHMKLWL